MTTVAVRHHREPAARVAMCDQVASEALVAAAVPEPRTAEEQAEADGVETAEPRGRPGMAGQHRRREIRPEDRRRRAGGSMLHADGEAREVARRRPQAGGSELGIDVPAAVHRPSIRPVRR